MLDEKLNIFYDPDEGVLTMSRQKNVVSLFGEEMALRHSREISGTDTVTAEIE